MSPGKHLYRSLLRELRLAIRKLVEGGSDAKQVERAILETRDFLRANRIYGELLRRYNPTHDMTQEERVKATARRVGLNAPLEFKHEE